MKVAIVGSRDFRGLTLVESFVRGLPEGTVIVSGGARGVDSVAERTARERRFDVIRYPAMWDTYGKGAGLIRNQQIVDEADEVVAFWDEKSPGTKDSIEKAKKSGKLKAIFNENGVHVNAY